MRAASLPLRLLLFPLDLIRMLVLALRISIWHLRVIFRSTLFHNVSGLSFCHPRHRDMDGIRVSVCPFAQGFANPRLFPLLCTHCRVIERGARELPVCRRKGGGPASSVTLVCFGIAPVLIFLLAFFWHLHPLTDVFHHMESWFAAPAAAPQPARPAPGREAAAVPPAPPVPEDPPRLPPLLHPGHARPTVNLPPPPLGFNPIERREKTAPPPDGKQ